ncbi:MAG: hypothetical protein L3J67_06765 [Hyphomicrobiaceae bacterium]|nr:hypothetical protein [Hyphomicrobiaceae bacterium]
MQNTIKRIACLGGVLSLLGLATSPALAHGAKTHATTDQKMPDCQNGNGNAQAGQAGAGHMKDCIGKNGEAMGQMNQMGQGTNMPLGNKDMGNQNMGNQNMGAHMHNGKMMQGH